ncbi:methyl-accepting chemotaxis protein [Kaistia dalseonensis]|uniref:Methyl-accepting chemotaxis protein WspA n=1 Tax=Kaistia dalseonensis TaxID=410840 RepID=A0ABU0H0P9_9HYPH|nr:methyl-accepting chemotaxis protein [Kaistia dalseonensis]MCX5493300.1 methyl-accepting chemotaxis protein [Kaistia dalseonensis]MDQ0435857.1 methyl-accepting chemotaxis protein WspA [Kaistia dalseonensis]
MKNVTIRQRIILSFLAILLVLSAIATVTYRWFLRTEREATSVEQNTVPALYLSGQLMAGWMEAKSLLQEFVVQDDPAEMDKVGEAIQTNRARLKDLTAAFDKTVDTDQDRQNLVTVQQLSANYVPVEDAILEAKRRALASLQSDDQKAAIKDKLNPITDQIRAALTSMVELNRAEADSSTQKIVSIVRSAETGLLIGAATALLLSFFCGFMLFRTITRPLGRLVDIVATMRKGDFTERLQLKNQDEFNTLADGVNAMADDLMLLIGQVQRSSIQVNTSITEVAATSKQQQATASEIAATTTEIGATAKQIAATSHELVRTMDEVSDVAEQTATLAGGGQAGLSRMEETMRRVMEAASAINAKLAVLSEKAGNINQVVTTITKVADQTNLLSLNAAIEAEKAGQYGRGFAVVATEIRRLADQTAVSSFDIEQMVKDIQSAVAAGVMGMDKFSEEVRRGMLDMQQVGDQLSEIIQQVQGLVPRFEIANEGMQAQATGAGQISEALSQLSEAVQQTVESLQQSTITIDELNQVSSGLRSSISRFKVRA